MDKLLCLIVFFQLLYQSLSAQIFDDILSEEEVIFDKNTKGFYSNREVKTEFFYITPKFSVIFDRKRKTLFILNKANLIVKKQKIKWGDIDFATSSFYTIDSTKVGFGSYHSGKYCAIISFENDKPNIDIQQTTTIISRNKVADFKKLYLHNGSILQATYLYPSSEDKTNKIVHIFIGKNTIELYKSTTDVLHTELVHQHPRIDIAYWKDKIYVFDADKFILQIHNTNGALLEMKQFSKKDNPNLNKIYTQFKIDTATDKLYFISRNVEKASIFLIRENNTFMEYNIPFRVSVGQMLDNKAYFCWYSKNQKNNYIYFTDLKEK